MQVISDGEIEMEKSDPISQKMTLEKINQKLNEKYKNE